MEFIGEKAFVGLSDIQGTTIIPSTVDTIGDYAFYRTALRQVTLPASVRRVGANAFPADCEVICLNPDAQILPPDAYRAGA